MSNAPSKPVSFSWPKVGYFSNRPRITIRGIHNGLHYCIIFTVRISIIYKCGRGPRLDTRDVKESIQSKVFSVSPEPRRAIHIFVMYDARLHADGTICQHILYVKSKHLTLTVKHLNKTRGPGKTANWNSGDCYGACSHAKRSEWSDASCQIK